MLLEMMLQHPALMVDAGFEPTLAMRLGVQHAAQWVEAIRRTLEDETFSPAQDIH